MSEPSLKQACHSHYRCISPVVSALLLVYIRKMALFFLTPREESFFFNTRELRESHVNET